MSRVVNQDRLSARPMGGRAWGPSPGRPRGAQALGLACRPAVAPCRSASVTFSLHLWGHLESLASGWQMAFDGLVF